MKNELLESIKINCKELLKNMDISNNSNIELESTGSTTYPGTLWQEISINQYYIYVSVLGLLETMKKNEPVNEWVEEEIKNIYKFISELYLEDCILESVKAKNIGDNLNIILKDDNNREHFTQLHLQKNFATAYMKGIIAYNSLQNNKSEIIKILYVYNNIKRLVAIKEAEYQYRMSNIKMNKKVLKKRYSSFGEEIW